MTQLSALSGSAFSEAQMRSMFQQVDPVVVVVAVAAAVVVVVVVVVADRPGRL
tara:strand:+ start:93 stop:251 length:159 start_codon:yes stop_codon:yes gene_type:complete